MDYASDVQPDCWRKRRVQIAQGVSIMMVSIRRNRALQAVTNWRRQGRGLEEWLLS